MQPHPLQLEQPRWTGPQRVEPGQLTLRLAARVVLAVLALLLALRRGRLLTALSQH